MEHQGEDRRILFNGIVRNTANTTAPDGEFEEIVNLRMKNGHLIPMNDHQPVKGLENVSLPYTYIYIHSNAYSHMIGVYNNAVWYFANIDDDMEVTMLTDPIKLYDVQVTTEVGVQYAQTGNLLTIIDGNFLKYAYWRDNAYQSLASNYNGSITDTSLVPEGRVDFRIAPKITKNLANEECRTIRCVKSDDLFQSNVFWGKLTEGDAEQRRTYSLGLMQKSRYISRKEGEPYGYFYICTAIKLYDGSYILQSKPTLITPPNECYIDTDFPRLWNLRRALGTYKNSELKTVCAEGLTRGYHDEYYEMPNKLTTNAKSFCFNPYENPQYTAMYKGAGYYLHVYTAYDNASGYISGTSGNIWGVKAQTDQGGSEEGAASEKIRVPDCDKIDQQFIGNATIPDLTCIYGNNTYGEGHAPAQGYAHFHTYGFFTCSYKGDNPQYIDNPDNVYSGSLYGGIATKQFYIAPTHTKGALPKRGYVGSIGEWYTAQVEDKTSEIWAYASTELWHRNRGNHKGSSTIPANWGRYDNDGDNFYYFGQNNICGGDMVMPEHLGSNQKGTPIWCANMPYKLQYKINAEIDPAYTDIIDSVCVFMTRQIEPTQINNDEIDNYLHTKDVHCNVVSVEHDTAEAPFYTQVFCKNNPNIGENYVIDRKSKDDIIKELGELKNFYLIKEIKLQNYKPEDWQEIDLKTDAVLLNLEQQEELDLDAIDRGSYNPKATLMYNGRLHLANYKNYLFKGFPFEYFMYHGYDIKGCWGQYSEFGESIPLKAVTTDYDRISTTYQQNYASSWITAKKYQALVEVDIKGEEGTLTVKRGMYPNTTTGILDFKLLNAFLAYPDRRAFKMRIKTQTVHIDDGLEQLYVKKGEWEFDLKAHDSLNMAYYLNPTLQPIKLDGYTDVHVYSKSDSTATINYLDYLDSMPTDTNCFIEVPNGMRVSKTNNPLVFPTENTYRVGNTRISALATNSIAVSEGQVGDMPLYVFANDGVYGLFVDSTGETAYLNSRPICRDVCNNWKSVTYTDAGVAFTTDRGLMLLTGSTPTDMTDVLEGKYLDFLDSTSVEYMSEAAAATNHVSLVKMQKYMTKEHILDYLKGAIVGYSTFDKELWVSNPTKDYSYVYSYTSNLWFKRSVSCEQYVNNYPYTYMLDDGALTILGEETTSGNQTMFLTRPIKFDTQEFKQAYRSIIRGYFHLKGLDYDIQAIDADDVADEPKLTKYDFYDIPEQEITVEASSATARTITIASPTTETLNVVDNSTIVEYNKTTTPDPTTYTSLMPYVSQTINPYSATVTPISSDVAFYDVVTIKTSPVGNHSAVWSLIDVFNYKTTLSYSALHSTGSTYTLQESALMNLESYPDQKIIGTRYQIQMLYANIQFKFTVSFTDGREDKEYNKTYNNIRSNGYGVVYKDGNEYKVQQTRQFYNGITESTSTVVYFDLISEGIITSADLQYVDSVSVERVGYTYADGIFLMRTYVNVEAGKVYDIFGLYRREATSGFTQLDNTYRSLMYYTNSGGWKEIQQAQDQESLWVLPSDYNKEIALIKNSCYSCTALGTSYRFKWVANSGNVKAQTLLSYLTPTYNTSYVNTIPTTTLPNDTLTIGYTSCYLTVVNNCVSPAATYDVEYSGTTTITYSAFMAAVGSMETFESPLSVTIASQAYIKAYDGTFAQNTSANEIEVTYSSLLTGTNYTKFVSDLPTSIELLQTITPAQHNYFSGLFYIIVDKTQTPNVTTRIKYVSENAYDNLTYQELMAKISSSNFSSFYLPEENITLQNNKIYNVVHSYDTQDLSESSDGSDDDVEWVNSYGYVPTIDTYQFQMISTNTTEVVAGQTMVDTIKQLDDSNRTIGIYNYVTSLPYSPAQITGTAGERLHVVNNVNSVTYDIIFSGTSPIATGEFLNNIVTDVYAKAAKTSFVDDYITVNEHSNIELTDNLNGGTTYNFYNDRGAMYIKYDDLLALIPFLPVTKTPFQEELTLWNGYYYQIRYHYASTTVVVTKTYDSTYPVTKASDFLAHKDDYEDVPTYDGHIKVRLDLGKKIELKDLQDTTYKFVVAQRTGERELVSIFVNLSDLLTAVHNSATSITAANGKTYTLTYVEGASYSWYGGIYLFGSYDARKWQFLGGNEKSDTIRDLGALVERVDCKYFRILFVGNLQSDSFMDFIDMSVRARLLSGKLR